MPDHQAHVITHLHKRRRLPQLAAVLVGLSLLASTAVHAAIGSWGSADTSVSLYVDGSPPALQSQLEDWGTYYDPLPPGTEYSARAEATVGSNTAQAFASGGLGLLRASASATFVNRYQPGVQGNSWSVANANFRDEWLVQGAGLADGTAVTLVFSIRISGADSSSSGGYGLSQRGSAALALEAKDKGVAGTQENFNWYSTDQGVGSFLWGYDTYVGRTVALSASFSAGASVDQYSTVGSMYADFSRTFKLYATPTLAGVSTVSLGGHDYALPAVPEPASWLLMACGGLALVTTVRRRPRPAGGR